MFSVEQKRVFVSTPAKTRPSLVEDCMTTNPMTLDPTATVDEAIQTLLSLGFNGAPVVDPKSGQLIGFLSALDVLEKEKGGALLPIIEGSNDEEMQVVVESARKICATTVADLMTPHVHTVEATTTVREAAELMTQQRLHRLCVVDGSTGALTGILSTSDVMADVMTKVRQSLPDKSSLPEDLGGNDDDANEPRLTP